MVHGNGTRPRRAMSLSGYRERNHYRQEVENSATKILPAGTTVITARGTVGKIACLGIPMSMNQTCYGIRGVSGYPDFITYLNIRLTARRTVQRERTESNFDTITRQTFKLVVPKALLPTRFSLCFRKHDRADNGSHPQQLIRIFALASQRDSLLPKLVSGKLQVKPRRKRQHD